MEDVLKQRQEFYDAIQAIKLKNDPEKTSKALKIMKQLLNNILQNPDVLKFRIIKTTNQTINNNLMNVVGIFDLLTKIGFVAEQDGNFAYNSDDLSKINICLNIINTDVTEIKKQEYIKETSAEIKRNPEVMKEAEAKRRKLEEEKEQRERINQMIEQDKEERKYKFKYTENK